MLKAYLISGLLAVALVIVLGFQSRHISEAYKEASQSRFDLTATNVKLDSLEKRIKDLEDIKALDEQRIAQLEARLPLK
jgi:cell division protein FtsB